MADDEVPSGGTEVGDDPPWDAWDPREVTRRLAGAGARWCVAAGWALDLFRGETTSIRLPYAQVIATTPEGMPYLVPQIVLLFKARDRRPKDQADFTGVLPFLDPARRAWLAAALARVHPGHPWISELQGRP